MSFGWAGKLVCARFHARTLLWRAWFTRTWFFPSYVRVDVSEPSYILVVLFSRELGVCVCARAHPRAQRARPNANQGDRRECRSRRFMARSGVPSSRGVVWQSSSGRFWGTSWCGKCLFFLFGSWRPLHALWCFRPLIGVTLFSFVFCFVLLLVLWCVSRAYRGQTAIRRAGLCS